MMLPHNNTYTIIPNVIGATYVHFLSLHININTIHVNVLGLVSIYICLNIVIL